MKLIFNCLKLISHYQFEDAEGMKMPPSTVCQNFDGVPDPLSKKCCSFDCGDFCGTKDCANGPGGSEHCCYLEIPDDKICGVDGQKAPCSLGTATHTIPIFQNKAFYKLYL